MRRLPLADRLRVRTPCTVGWDTLPSGGRDRFCEHCNMHVHDVASMTRAEAERLVRRREEGERVCLHLHVRRSDGAILVADGHVKREEPRPPRTTATAMAIATATMLSACASPAPRATTAAAPATELRVDDVPAPPAPEPLPTEATPQPVETPKPAKRQPPPKAITPAPPTSKHPERPANYDIIDGGAW